jgi:Sec23/Sec24 trunk domain/Sec23/Sec24 zinc finger
MSDAGAVEQQHINSIARFNANLLPVGGRPGLPVAALITPFANNVGAHVLYRQPVLCVGCAAYINAYCSLRDDGCWQCCFCGADNACFADNAATDRAAYPELTARVVDYLDRGGSLATLMAGLSLESAAPAYILVVDGSLPKASLTELADSLSQVLQQLEPKALLALVVYRSAVSVYRLGSAGAAVAVVLPGQQPLSAEHTQAVFADGAFFGTVAAHTADAAAVLRMLRGAEGVAATATDTDTAEQQQQVPIRQRRRQRCLGAAVHYALQLARSRDSSASRVLVFSAGCPNCGPGALQSSVPRSALAVGHDADALKAAVQCYSDLAKSAQQQGTGQ